MKKNVLFLSLTLMIGLSTWTAKAVNETVQVGSSQTYTTLKSAFDAINSGVLTGAVKLEITSDITEATNFPILNASGVANVSPAGTASYSSVHIYPTGSAWTITGATNGQLFVLNGADNVNIDGRLGGVDGGTPNSLTISNTNVGAGTTWATIALNASAENNTIQYCTVRGAGTNLTSGVIRIEASASGNGNDGNTITYNTIAGPNATSTTGRPYNAIAVLGTGVNNDNGSITYNNFPQFIMQISSISNGINFNGAAQTGWNISNNSFYDDIAGGTIAPTGSKAKTAIQIIGGTGFTINNNFIGGTGPSCSGNLIKTGSNEAFIGINLGLSADGTTSSIQGNTIKNISWTNSATQTFKGIVVSGAGSVNVGTTTGNTIGGTGGSASSYAITYTPATGTGTFTGIEISTTGTADVQKNTVASIKTDNIGAFRADFIGINKTAVAGTTTISNNVIGSLTEAGSINCAKSVAAQQLYPINCAGTGTNTISNNTVSNILHNTTTGQTYALRLNPTSASTTTVNANFIQKLDMIDATTGSIYGIYIQTGVGTYTNNIISITTDNPVNIYGIHDQGASGNNSNIYHNTVYIAGSPATLALNSHAINLSATAVNTCNIKNNIFVNARTNTGTASGKHYAARFANPTYSSITLDYNNYYATGGWVGQYYIAGTPATATDVASPESGTAVTILASQDSHSIYTNPTFANAGGTTAASYTPTVTLTGADIHTTVASDYLGLITRTGTPEMGALEKTAGGTPTISTTGTLSAVNTTYGTASASPTTFSVSGANMSAGILVTPPAGYEVSLAEGSGYASTVTVTGTGTISSTPVYVRLAATTAVGSYSGNIVLTSTDATTVNVATVSSAVAAKGLTITGLTGANKPYDGGTSASFTGTAAYSGIVNGDNATVTGTPSASFATATVADGKTIAVIGYTAPSANYTLTQPTLSGNITKVALTITADNQSVAYGTTDATVIATGTYTPTGFVNGEGSGVIGGSISYSTTHTNTTAAATLGVTITPIVTGLTATNYSFTPANGAITITEADVTVSSSNTNVNSLTLSPVSNITVSGTGSLVINQSKEVNSITVNSGAKLSVATGQTLTLTNLTLKSDASGTSTFVNDGTLTLTGTATVEQYLATTRNWYVSSPVSNAVAPAGYTYYKRNEAGSSWTAVSVGNGLTAGIGYIALPGTTGHPITFTTESGGTLNSGNVTIPITYTALAPSAKGYNLIGNPYPAHLTWTTAFVDNNVSLIEPSIYYRTNAGSVNNGGDAAWSFKTYNSKTNEFSPVGTTNIIPPMQAFWIRAKASGNLILNSDLTKSHQTSNPLKAPALNNSDRQRVRLQVTNGTRTDETVLLFDTNAADGYDVFDSPKFAEAGTEVQIYTTVDNEKLVINGMKNMPLNQEIALGFVAGSETSFSIKANEISNLPSDVRVILKDNVKKTETDLTDGVSIYQFGQETNSENRFYLLFRAPSSPNALNIVEKLNAQVFVNAANQITIVAPEKANYAIYNAVGMLLENGQTTAKLQTVNCKLQTGMYVVRVSENGKELTTRVIIK